MAKSGELMEIWDVAAKTNLQFNMVRPQYPCSISRAGVVLQPDK
jgi:hypothetical protein